MASMSGLHIKGEAAPKATISSTSLSATIRVNRPNHDLAHMPTPYPLVFNSQAPNEDLTVTALNGPTVPVRKIEHLNRVRTANFGISTMDDSFDFPENESTFVIEKPHFVLCGLPIGSKEIDHHLYVNETRVGSFKTSARAMYQARRGPRSAKALSEPAMQMADRAYINPKSSLPEVNDGVKPIPPIPPTTPVNYAHYIAMIKPKTAAGRLIGENGNFHGSIPAEVENNYIPSDLVKHKKLTLMRREKTADSLDLQREQSSISNVSIRSMETVSESVVNNNFTVTTGKGARLVNKSVGKTNVAKVNYNNPYRNTKHKERMALNGNRRFEFNSLDTYLKYQKQNNGRHIMTPRAVLRIPKPCSDTFLLQMMYDLNRPVSRRSTTSTRYSDIARIRDFEEFVHTRTSSSLSKAQSNIDKYMAKARTGGSKSIKSVKSAKSAATETIEEELEDLNHEHEIDCPNTSEKTESVNGAK